ncbi:MAG: helix-turn-helix transcriptional regulator [Lachnospiraceae bacterium]|nr:helix-turn-helix transcriptional regulator [Lachnospiraceae bacterium]
MGIPIPPGYNFRFRHDFRDNHYAMPCADVYGDCYGIGYMVHSERLIITPGKTVVVQPGCIQFMHKHLYHRTVGVTDDINENYGIKFRECIADRIISAIGKEAFDSLFAQINIHLTDDSQRKIIHLFSIIEQEWTHFDEYSNAAIENVVIQLFIETLRGQTNALSPQTPSAKALPLTDALHYMEINYAQDPSLEQTAKAIHISPAHLSRMFTTELETLYSRFLTEIKLNHAMRLLLSSKLPITEVAAQTGFKNSNYFSDVFKKYIGISPLQYRKGSTDKSDCAFLPFEPILQ